MRIASGTAPGGVSATGDETPGPNDEASGDGGGAMPTVTAAFEPNGGASGAVAICGPGMPAAWAAIRWRAFGAFTPAAKVWDWTRG